MLYQPTEQATLLLRVLDPQSESVSAALALRMESLIAEAAALGFQHIHLVDERPHLIADVRTWAQQASEAHLAFTVSTDCTGPVGDADLIAGAYIRLHGCEHEHDRITGIPGDYRRRLAWIKSAGALPVVVTCHLTRPGQHDLARVYREAAAPGSRAFVVSPAMAAKGDENAFGLDEGPYVLELVESLKRFPTETTIRLGRGWLPVKGLLEHPCNAFACSGHNCHAKKGNRPRHLVIHPSGEVVAEDPRLEPAFTLGSLAEDSLTAILNRWPGSDLERLWLHLCDQVFTNYVIPCPFPLVPWLDALVAESQTLVPSLAGAQ